jgi:hypothetical protein
MGGVPRGQRLPRGRVDRRPAAMHDAYRVDKGGKPTFDRVMPGSTR